MSVDVGVRLLSLVKPWSPKTAFGRHCVVTVWASHLSFLPCRTEHQMLALCILFVLVNGVLLCAPLTPSAMPMAALPPPPLGCCAEEATL